jgi:hypothetical protein
LKDADRPPVLAHQRFDADRASFAGLNLAERFKRIEQTNLWGAETSVSGLGSEHAATTALCEALPMLLAQFEIKVLLDAPCGDAGWIMSAGLDIDYIGIDIVPSLIARNSERGTNPRQRFLVGDITRDKLPRADLILCRDCLVHLTFENIASVIANFRSSAARWLLATTFPRWNRNLDCEDGDWRALNMQCEPFNWPEPVALIDEQCDEGGGGWSDKSLGLWRMVDIPA